MSIGAIIQVPPPPPPPQYLIGRAGSGADLEGGSKVSEPTLKHLRSAPFYLGFLGFLQIYLVFS